MSLLHIILLLVLSTIAAANWLRYRDVLYPPVIHAGVWAGVLLLFSVYEELFYPLSGAFYAVLLSGVVLFSIGSALTTKGYEPDVTRFPDIAFSPKSWYENALYWIPLLGVLPFILVTTSLGQSGPFESFYRNLRWSIVTAEDTSAGGALGLVSYLVPLAYTSLILQTLLGHYRTRPGRFWTTVAVALFYSLLVTGRMSFFFLLVVVSGILAVTRRVRPIRMLAGVAVLGVLLFVVLGLALENEGAGFTVLETIENMQRIVVAYALGALPAFDQFMHTHGDWSYGESTFRSILAVLSKLGFDVEVRSTHFEFTMVPHLTNVYTIYRPYYADFSIWGVLILQFALGAGHGAIYKKATQGNLYFVAIYALSLFPLILQFYQDRYFSLFSLWIQFGILLFLFFYRVRLTEER